MKVVIDTNVILSAAMRGGLPQRLIDRVVSDADLQWVAVPELVDEYLDILRRPRFLIVEAKRERWIKLILRETMVDLPDIPEVLFPRDPNDAKVLAAALAWNADYLVTGDRDFADAPDLGATRIVTPPVFADVLGIS